MTLSRRSFLRGSVAATMLPLVPACGPRPAPVAPVTSGLVDYSMGYAPGAIRLDKNENPYGPSPQAMRAIEEGLVHANRYVNSKPLREALAREHGVEVENIRMGTGSGEVLRVIPFATLMHGGSIVAPREAYRATPRMAENMQADVRWISLRDDWSFDIDAMLAAVDGTTRIFYLVNPNNPTGTTLTYAEVKAVADALPGEVMFLLDEAYSHFLPDGMRTGIDLFKAGYENVFVTRTFSKAHGLAGLRVGYGIGHPDAVERITKFISTGMNTAAFGGAMAALRDPDHAMKFVGQARRSRVFWEEELEALGLPYVVGNAPLVMVEVGDSETVVDAMAGMGVHVRKGESWDVPRYVRISYGLDEHNERAAEALRAALGKG